MNWRRHTRDDQSYNLTSIWKEEHQLEEYGGYAKNAALRYLDLVEHYSLITSKEVAAVALATADYICLTQFTK